MYYILDVELSCIVLVSVSLSILHLKLIQIVL